MITDNIFLNALACKLGLRCDISLLAQSATGFNYPINATVGQVCDFIITTWLKQ